MLVWTLLLLSVGVAADAFAVALGKGLAVRREVVRNAFVLAFAFGIAQGIMPLLGWMLGSAFADVIAPFDHWIAFALLALVGGKMLWEAIFPGDEHDEAGSEDTLGFREVLILSIATSIDALAVGVSLTTFDVNIWIAVGVIAAVTFVLSFVAVLIGHRVGTKFQRPAEILGGLVLIGIGVSIVVEHLGA